MKICVYGGGAIGGYLAGHLAHAGQCEVSVVARGSMLAAIATRGLSVITPDERFTVYPRVTDDPSTLGHQDVVLVTVKAQQFGKALAGLSALLGERTVVVPPTTGLPYWFFNGVPGPFRDHRLPRIDPDGRQWATVHPERVIGCVYWIGAHVAEPGVVVQDGARAGCPIGEPDGSRSERALALEAVLRASGVETRISADIRAAVWLKAVNSLCWNPIAVMTRATMGEMADDPDVVAIVRTMMQEADAAGRALGLEVAVPPEKRIALTLAARRHRMSMLQDMERGRELEWSALEDSFRSVRDLVDVPMPTLDAVVSLMGLRVRAHENARGAAIASSRSDEDASTMRVSL